MQSPELGSLDAIHIASAHEMGTSVRQIVTYDERMVEAAKAGGLSVASPSSPVIHAELRRKTYGVERIIWIVEPRVAHDPPVANSP